jgi:hypothetical protein
MPGLYYNGTLTVTHRISQNSAWTVESLLDEGYDLPYNWTDNRQCSKDERDEKTYEYPALFHVGPRGNAEDLNPLHWSLKGFEPTDGPYLDILQRLVHIRSSDFNLDRPKRKFAYWEGTNADDPKWETETVNGTAYWSTSLSEAKGGGSYSARSTYDHRVPTSGRTSLNWYPKSQYLTLTETCRLGFSSVNEEYDMRSDPDADEEEEEEEDDEDSFVYDTSMRPTVWLEPGVVANIGGIGSDELTFSLDTEWTEPTTAFTGFRRAGCGSNQKDARMGYEAFLYYAGFIGMSKEASDGDVDVSWPTAMWNLTLSAKLEFKGSIVRENSTEIKGLSDGILQFAEDYDYEEKEKELGYPGTSAEEEDDDSGAQAVEVHVLLPILTALSAAWMASLVL